MTPWSGFVKDLRIWPKSTIEQQLVTSAFKGPSDFEGNGMFRSDCAFPFSVNGLEFSSCVTERDLGTLTGSYTPKSSRFCPPERGVNIGADDGLIVTTILQPEHLKKLRIAIHNDNVEDLRKLMNLLCLDKSDTPFRKGSGNCGDNSCDGSQVESFYDISDRGLYHGAAAPYPNPPMTQKMCIFPLKYPCFLDEQDTIAGYASLMDATNITKFLHPQNDEVGVVEKMIELQKLNSVDRVHVTDFTSWCKTRGDSKTSSWGVCQSPSIAQQWVNFDSMSDTTPVFEGNTAHAIKLESISTTFTQVGGSL